MTERKKDFTGGLVMRKLIVLLPFVIVFVIMVLLVNVLKNDKNGTNGTNGSNQYDERQLLIKGKA